MGTVSLQHGRRAAEEAAGREINHFVTVVESNGTIDHSFCSCGWECPSVSDGVEGARDEWVKHIQAAGAEIAYPES